MDTLIDLGGLSRFLAKCRKEFSNMLMENITWSELKNRRDQGNLKKGAQYRIIDYECTTTQTDTMSAKHPFDIIVTADEKNKLNENARAALHEGDYYFSNAGAKLEAWELKYCLDNDSARFAWVDTTDGKGVIYWMKDEFNNECPYDFKNIQFKRYNYSSDATLYKNDSSGTNNWTLVSSPTSSPAYAAINIRSTASTQNSLNYYFIENQDIGFYQYWAKYAASPTSSWYFTFGSVDRSLEGKCRNNVIKPYYPNGQTGASLNNIVFCAGTTNYGCRSNTIRENCRDITIHDNSSCNFIDINCTNIIIGVGGGGNANFIKGISNRIYISSSSGNTVSGYDIIISRYSSNNVVTGNSVALGTTCNLNEISIREDMMTFAILLRSGSSSNTIRSSGYPYNITVSGQGNILIDCYDIIISGHYNQLYNSHSITLNNANGNIGNIFNSGCHDITMTSSSYNTFGQGCTNIKLGEHNDYNTFGNLCTSVNFGSSATSLKNYYRYITIEDGVKYVNLNCTATTTSSNNYFQNVTVEKGFNTTTSYKTIGNGNVNQAYKTIYRSSNTQIIEL